jgi:hypothetical protein
MDRFSRRGLLKGAVGLGGAAAGTRLLGPMIGEAQAQLAGETSHLVHIFWHGGINALFTGCAQILNGKFSVTGDNMQAVGNGVFTDKGTFGTLPKIALDHWAGIGLRHGDANHTVPENRNGGGEMSIIRNGNNNYLVQLAAAMGGESTYKAALFGGRSQVYGIYADWPAVEGVSLQRVSNLKDVLGSVGATNDPNAPDRAKLAATIEAADAMSKRQIETNPGRLESLSSAYDASAAALKKPAPPPVTMAELDTAYGLGGRTSIFPRGTTSFAAQLAGAELMIRAAGTNVIHVSDFEPMWDFDANVNGPRSRDAFLGNSSSWGRYNRVNPIKTFMQRMLDFPGKNVVVVLSGEFVRTLSGHGHGSGVVAAVFGKYVKQGLSYPVDGSARFATGTPGTKEFWAGVASALKVPGQPFGKNPHALLGA